MYTAPSEPGKSDGTACITYTDNRHYSLISQNVWNLTEWEFVKRDISYKFDQTIFSVYYSSPNVNTLSESSHLDKIIMKYFIYVYSIGTFEQTPSDHTVFFIDNYDKQYWSLILFSQICYHLSPIFIFN